MSAPAITELGLAASWWQSVLNADSVITGVAGYGGIWEAEAPSDTIRPFFVWQDMTSADVNTATGIRIYSGLMLLLKAVGEASQSAAIETLYNRADYLLTPKPNGAAIFPVSFMGGWILSCERVRPHQLTYISATKLYTDKGGVYAVQAKTH